MNLHDFWGRLSAFFAKLPQAPGSIWRGTAGQPWLRVFMICCLIGLVGALIYSPYAFIRAPWKEKGKMLFTFTVVLLVLAVIFYFALM